MTLPETRPVKPVIVVGHAALDRVYRVDAIPEKPTKVRAFEHIESGGGTASNAAAAIGRLGGRVELWSRAGDDANGDTIVRLLAAEGVDVTHVLRPPGTRSATAAVIVDRHGERLIVSERDQAMPMDPGWLPLARVARAGAVLSDLSWLEATLAVFAAAQRLGVPRVLDADVNGVRLLEAVLPATGYAICSSSAMHAWMPGASDDERLTRLISLGVRHAGITLGADGYVWRTTGGATGRQPALGGVSVVDTTGAGDAFHGAFAFSLAQGLPDAECARVGAAAAALKCRALGARQGLPSLTEVDTLLREETGTGLPAPLAALV